MLIHIHVQCTHAVFLYVGTRVHRTGLDQRLSIALQETTAEVPSGILLSMMCFTTRLQILLSFLEA